MAFFDADSAQKQKRAESVRKIGFWADSAPPWKRRICPRNIIAETATFFIADSA